MTLMVWRTSTFEEIEDGFATAQRQANADARRPNEVPKLLAGEKETVTCDIFPQTLTVILSKRRMLFRDDLPEMR